jgi:hypothetical protein
MRACLCKEQEPIDRHRLRKPIRKVGRRTSRPLLPHEFGSAMFLTHELPNTSQTIILVSAHPFLPRAQNLRERALKPYWRAERYAASTSRLNPSSPMTGKRLGSDG